MRELEGWEVERGSEFRRLFVKKKNRFSALVVLVLLSPLAVT